MNPANSCGRIGGQSISTRETGYWRSRRSFRSMARQTRQQNCCKKQHPTFGEKEKMTVRPEFIDHNVRGKMGREADRQSNAANSAPIFGLLAKHVDPEGGRARKGGNGSAFPAGEAIFFGLWARPTSYRKWQWRGPRTHSTSAATNLPLSSPSPGYVATWMHRSMQLKLRRLHAATLTRWACSPVA